VLNLTTILTAKIVTLLECSGIARTRIGMCAAGWPKASDRRLAGWPEASQCTGVARTTYARRLVTNKRPIKSHQTWKSDRL